MGIADWWKSLRRRQREEELERADAAAVETPEEREYVSGDIESRAADMRAAGAVHEPPGSIERLGR